MKIFDEEKIIQPESSSGWRQVQIGFSKLEVRLITYTSIMAFFIVNGFFVYLWGVEYIHNFFELIGPTPIFSIFSIFTYLAGYFILHEATHVILHPDHGLSEKTMIGVNSAMVFVLFNDAISKRRMLMVLLAPFFILTMLITIFVYCNIEINKAILVNMVALHLIACLGDLLLFYKFITDRSFSNFWNAYSSSWAK